MLYHPHKDRMPCRSWTVHCTTQRLDTFSCFCIIFPSLKANLIFSVTVTKTPWTQHKLCRQREDDWNSDLQTVKSGFIKTEDHKLDKFTRKRHSNTHTHTHRGNLGPSPPLLTRSPKDNSRSVQWDMKKLYFVCVCVCGDVQKFHYPTRLPLNLNRHTLYHHWPPELEASPLWFSHARRLV